MTLPLSTTVERLIRERMASGQYASEDDLLTEALQALNDSDDELQAIQEGIDSVDRGETGVPLNEAFRKLLDKHR